MSKNKIYNLAMLLLPIAMLIPWAIMQYDVRINGDTAFLFSGMQKLLQGQIMSEALYDTNPPMSFLVYWPAVFLHEAIGISKHAAINIYTFILIGLSYLATYIHLRSLNQISPNTVAIFMATYIASACIFFYSDFGIKDHLITIALIPFLLAQMRLNNEKATLVTLLTFCLCVPFILVKPHYGLLPVALIFYRLSVQKNILQIFRSDFWILAIATISYVLVTLFFFADFVSEILPNSLKFYINATPYIEFRTRAFTFMGIAGVLCLFTSLANAEDEKSETAKVITLFFSIFTALAIIPYLVQNKGYAIHFLPALLFFNITLVLLVSLYAQKIIEFHRIILATFIIAVVALLHYPIFIRATMMTKSDFLTSEFSEEINDHSSDKSFFIEAHETNVIWPHLIYHDDFIFASRFPGLWFLSDFDNLTRDEQFEVWTKYGALMAEDFAAQQPQYLAFIKHDGQETAGIIKAFGNHPELGPILKQYEYSHDFTIDSQRYMFYNPRKKTPLQDYAVYILKK